MTMYKYTDKNGTVVYTQTPPALADAQVVKGFTGNTQGVAQTRPLAGGSSRPGSNGGQSEEIKRQNAERRALVDDVNAKARVLDQKITAYGAAANRLNASRDLLFSDMQATNAALKDLDGSQDTSGYVFAALAVVGTGIVLVATAPAAIVVGGVLVVGASVAGEVGDRLRPASMEPSDHATADSVKKTSKSALRGLEAYEAVENIHKAGEVLAEGGKAVAHHGSRAVPILGAAVTVGTAVYTAETTAANQLAGNINSTEGLQSLRGKLENYDPSFLERKVAGFNKDRLLGEIDRTVEAQKEYDEAVRQLEEARTAFHAAVRAWNDIYVAPKGQ